MAIRTQILIRELMGKRCSTVVTISCIRGATCSGNCGLGRLVSGRRLEILELAAYLVLGIVIEVTGRIVESQRLLSIGVGARSSADRGLREG